VASVVLGATAFLAIGSVAAGTTPAPDPVLPVGAVAMATDPPSARVISPDPPEIAPTSAHAAPNPSSTTHGAILRSTARHGAQNAAPPTAGLTGYRWPLPKGRLTQPFGPTRWGSRVVDGKSFHDGIDLATFCGDRIVAAHDGIVLAAGRRYDDAIGWLGDLTAYYRRLDAKKLWTTLPIVVVIDDGNGYRSMYAHFGKVVVKRGQSVRAGELLGYEGRTGNASGCHLHYGLFSPFERGEIAIEPSVAKRMKLPREEIARIDPLLVLPVRDEEVSAADTGER
jgi:murein DD-endopeptidase MepM/ murein hydrolase activator NlpD